MTCHAVTSPDGAASQLVTLQHRQRVYITQHGAAPQHPAKRDNTCRIHDEFQVIQKQLSVQYQGKHNFTLQNDTIDNLEIRQEYFWRPAATVCELGACNN